MFCLRLNCFTKEGINLKLREISYDKIGLLICGDEGPSQYLSGPQLVKFFNNLGSTDEYNAASFPVRRIYAADKAKEFIENGKINDLVNQLLYPINYLNNDIDPKEVLDYFNKILIIEGYKIKEISENGVYKIVDINNKNIIVNDKDLKILSSEFLDDQINKCNQKISQNDYYGAITNARSMVEEVLLLIEEDIDGQRGTNSGDMSALYKRVSKKVNLNAGQKGLTTPLQQILSGLNNVVIGLAGLRTKASDSHAPEYKPSKHHAELAVNCAMTFTSFILNSYQYQKQKNCK